MGAYLDKVYCKKCGKQLTLAENVRAYDDYLFLCFECNSNSEIQIEESEVKEGQSIQIHGCWSSPKRKFIHEKCGADMVECPREGHPNSKFWVHEREDGLVLFVCSNNCPEDEINM